MFIFEFLYRFDFRKSKNYHIFNNFQSLKIKIIFIHANISAQIYGFLNRNNNYKN